MAMTAAAARSDTPPNAWCGLRFGQPSSDDPLPGGRTFLILPLRSWLIIQRRLPEEGAPPFAGSSSEWSLRQHRQHRQRVSETCPTEQLAGQWAGSCPRKRQISIAAGFCSEPGSGNADRADGADGTFKCARILMILLPSRPPRLNVILMPKTRRKLCARRRRPAIARGFWGQPVLSLNIPSTPRSAPARKRSAALPIHELRSAMISRTQAATGSASIMPSIAALRFAS